MTTGPDMADFVPMAWAPGGKLLAGSMRDAAGSARQIGCWDFESRRFLPWDVATMGVGLSFMGRWMPDGQRAVLRTKDGIVLYDISTRRSVVLAPSQPADVAELSRDGRALVIPRDVYDAHVWQAELRGVHEGRRAAAAIRARGGVARSREPAIRLAS